MNALAPSQPMLDALAIIDQAYARKILRAFKMAEPQTKAEIIEFFEEGAPAKLLAASRRWSMN